MITLITGQPGAGKTLLTLFLAKQEADKDKRPVFYSGIPELALPWTEIEGDRWHEELPAGAIAVIDECQRYWRPRANGAATPPSVAAMETHRHMGVDLYLITQHPMLLDQNVRRLVGRHFHVMRAFGASAANIHEWGEVNLNPDKSRKGSQKRPWKYPKEVYSWYKSAEVHTHKFRLPPRVLALALAPVVLIGAIWGFVHVISGLMHPEKKEAAPTAATAQAQPGTGGSSGDKTRVMTPAEFAQAWTPRVEGLPHTAPIYDQVTQPADAPVPTLCVDSKKTGCRCWTQQHTRYTTTQDVCRQIVRDGFYIPWKKPEPEPPPQQRLQETQPVSFAKAAENPSSLPTPTGGS